MVSRQALSSSIPVRFPVEIVEAVKTIADKDGITVSEWIRRAVTVVLSAQESDATPATIMDDLRRDLDRLAAKIS